MRNTFRFLARKGNQSGPSLRRRAFLTGAAAVACPLCAGLASRTVLGSESGHPTWSYGGATGPAEWGSLSADYAVCSSGRAQSPIDLTHAVRAQIPATDIAWQTFSHYGVLNNGHTIQVNVPEGSRVTLLGKDYALKQFHFHRVSEHTVNGEHYPMEAHFVHQADDDSLAVIGVFLEEGAENAALVPIWQVMPTDHGEVDVTDRAVDPNALLPGARSAYLYHGSLTTPPCSQVVTWYVFDTPATASAQQIAAFDALYPDNYRPLQPLNRRFLLLAH